MMPAGRTIRIQTAHPPKRHPDRQARAVSPFVISVSTALERWGTMPPASDKAPACVVT